MEDQEIIDIFLKYVDSLKEATLFGDAWITIKWYLIYGLYQILNLVKGWQTQILTFFDFYKYAGLKTFIDQYQVIAVAIAVLVLVATILIFIYTNKHDYRGLFSNFIFGIFMMFGLSIFVSMLTPIARDVIGLSTATETSELQVIRENLIDFRTIDQDGWQWNYDDDISDDNENQPNELSRGIVKEYVLGQEVTTVDSKATNYLKLISPAETIDSKSEDITADGKAILGKKLIYTYGKYTLEKGTSWWKPRELETSYYRYNFRFWRLLFYFLIKLVVAILLMWKLGKILLEMNFSILYGQIAGLTDLRTGKRNIMVLQSVFNSIIVVVLIFILQRLFDIGYVYIDSVTSNFFFGLFMKAILASFIIDGPNLVEKLFGIDSGLSSMGNTLMSLNQGSQILGGLASGIGRGVGAVGNMAKGLTGATASFAGATAGANKAFDDLNDYFDQQEADSENDNSDANDSSNDNQDDLNSNDPNSPEGNGNDDSPLNEDVPNSDLNGQDTTEAVSDSGTEPQEQSSEIPNGNQENVSDQQETEVNASQEQSGANVNQATESEIPSGAHSSHESTPKEPEQQSEKPTHSSVPKANHSGLNNNKSDYRGTRADVTEAYHQGKFNTLKNVVSDTASNKFNNIHQVKKFNAAKTVTYDNVMNAYQERLAKYQNKEESE